MMLVVFFGIPKVYRNSNTHVPDKKKHVETVFIDSLLRKVEEIVRLWLAAMCLLIHS